MSTLIIGGQKPGNAISYRNPAIALIASSRLLFRIPTQSSKSQFTELRRVLRICDDALSMAACSGEEVLPDEINKRFERAIQTLRRYGYKFQPNTDIVGSWRAISRDLSEGMSVPIPQSPMIAVDFVIFKTLPDPRPIVVRQVLDRTADLDVVLWNFSRFKDDRRITLRENPHFYLDLPTSVDGYTGEFNAFPVQNLQLTSNATIYVLVDQPSCIFLETEQETRIFGNVYIFKDVMIFKDIHGILEGESLVRESFRGMPNLWHYQGSHSSELPGSSRPTYHRGLPHAIMTNPAAEWTCEDWRHLIHIHRRQGLDNNDLHIHARQRPPDFARELILPPSPPTSERAGYKLLYTTADTLNIDVLLTIFNHYRLDDEEGWNTQLGWCKLSHVCRKWRHLIYESCLYLNIFINVTNDTPSLDKLAHFPSLPLVIDCCSSSYAPARSLPRRLATGYWSDDTTEDDSGVLLAIQQHDRVRRIALEVMPLTLAKLIAPMDEPFPILEALSLLSMEDPWRDAMLMLTLPREFSAPNLRHLELRGIHLSRGLSFLASTLFLVTLKLTQIQSPGYFAPEDLVAQLQHIPRLEELSIGFSVSMRRAGTEEEPSHTQTTVTTLPSLKWLVFQGEATYLEGMIALISVPLLERLKITLFYEPTFHLSHLFGLIKTTEGLWKPVASVIFCDLYDRAGVSFAVGSRDELGNRSLILEIRCYLFSQQVQSVTRLCGALLPDLAITDLTLSIDKENLELGWQNVVGGVAWRGLLQPFRSVQKLRIHHLLALQLSDALGFDGAGSAPGLLPMLGELESQMGGSDAFAAFIRERERAGRPVRLSSESLWQQLRGLLAVAEIRAQAPLLAGHPQAP